MRPVIKLLVLFGLVTIAAVFLGETTLHEEDEDTHAPLWVSSMEGPCGAEEPLTTTEWRGEADHERRNEAHERCQVL